MKKKPTQSPPPEHWIREVIQLALDCIGDGDHSPFILVRDEDGNANLLDLQSVDGKIDSKLVESGREMVNQLKPTAFHALVWDGAMTAGEKTLDAIVAEVGGSSFGLEATIVQAYRIARTGKVVKIGKPIVEVTKEGRA